MLSAESLPGARALGEESLQMWDLNKRLEAYLARVKFLEEENEVLRAEIQTAKSSPASEPWRVRYEEELRALRDALDCAFREKCSAELARDNLYEEVQQVKGRCQKEQTAREEAKKLLSLSRKELEEERRAQIWLKERAVQLEKEVEALLEVHEEEKAGLDQELASISLSLDGFRCTPVAFQPVEVQDYSKRLSEIWRGAVETYKTEVSQLEGSLCQAKENLWKAVEGNQQNQLQLQHLEKELSGLRVRKELLEENLAQQWQEQRGEAEKFQLAMEALEQEKQRLRVQIAQVLEDRQQLMHLKMSLSLEVATYRTLLEAESTRLQIPAGEYKLPNSLRDLKPDVSSSKLVPMSAESRRLLPRDHRASPSVYTRAEGRGLQAKAQSDTPVVKSQSPGAGELQKIGSALHVEVLKAASTAREMGAPCYPPHNPSQPGTAAPPLSPEPPSPVQLEPGSSGEEGPAWLLGDEGEMSQGKENLPPAVGAEPPDGSAEPPGVVSARSLRYPVRLVSDALEDALKEMKDDAQSEEEPVPGRDPQDAPSPVPTMEVCGEADGGQDPSEGAGDGEAPEVEERVGEFVFQGLGLESKDLWDRTMSPSGSQSCGTTGTELGTWQEEMPTKWSPRDPEIGSQEDDTSGQEEPEQRQDEVEAPGTEISHPDKEEEEERSPCSPSVKDKGGFQGEGAATQEVEAACAFLVGSCPVLPTEGHLEEDVDDGERERFELRETLLCEMDPAAEEEQEQETCPEQTTLSIHDSTAAEEASSGAEEAAVGEEDPDRAKHGKEEHGEASQEVLGGEDPQAGESVGAETPGQEVRAEKELGDLQEELWEQEEQELGEEPWSREDDNNQKPEDWKVTEEDTEGTEEPSCAEDTPTKAGGLESGARDCSSPVELEETPGDEEDAQNWGMSQQELPLEAEPDQELARDEQKDTTGHPALEPTDILGQGGSQEPAQALQEPWEMQAEAAEAQADEVEDAESGAAEAEETEKAEAEEAEVKAAEAEKAEVKDAEAEDGDDELDSKPGQQESSSTGSAAPEQAPGNGADGRMLEEEEEEDSGTSGELELTPGTHSRVELEETLPDSTPLHPYEGQVLDVVTSSQTPPEPEEGTETDPESQPAPEDGGWDKPLSPTVPESHEEEAAMEVGPEAEGAEEEEGYFMVSAPSHEVSSSEEVEISDDFEEIKVEATESSKDELEAPGETSPVSEDEGSSEGLAGEDVEMPTAEPGQWPKGGDEEDVGGSTAELEEGSAVLEADPSPTGASGGADGPASSTSEGPGCSEDLVTVAGQEPYDTAEPENDADKAQTLTGGSLGLLGQEEETEEDEPGTAHQDTGGLFPLAGLQAMPDVPEQTWNEQPLGQEALDGDALPLAKDEECPKTNPLPLGSAAEGQGGCPEVVQEHPEVPKLPADVVRDSDILEIVEQALEFNQELVMGVKEAEGGQQDPGETEDSSPASSSEEEPTVQEALGEQEALGMQEAVGELEAPQLEAPVQAPNGLHRDTSLEDLAEFTEEVPNGIGSSPLVQETLREETPDDARLAGATACAKPGSVDITPISSALGSDVLHLTPQQPPACLLRAEMEP